MDPRASGFTDVVLTWYTIGTGGIATGFNNLTFIRCGPFDGTVLTFSVLAGRDYYIQASDNTSGGGTLTLRFGFVAPPANDTIAGAQAVTRTSETAVVSVPASVETAAGEPRSCGGNIRTVWYKIDASWTGTVTVDPGRSSLTDTVLAAYRSAGGSGYGGGLTNVGCSSPQSGGSMAFSVSPGYRYYVQALDVSSGGGTLRLTFLLHEPIVSVPADMTVEATGFDGAVATFSATATDPEDGAITPACVPASGATFALGTSEVRCSAVDTNGQIGAAAFSITVVDTTGPAIALAGALASYMVDDTVALTATATDLVDGVLTPTCTLTNDATEVVVSTSCTPAVDAWTLGLGTFSFSVDSTDAHRNPTSTSVQFRVDSDYPSVTHLTKQWVWKAGVAKELVSLLGAASAAERRGQDRAAADKLTEYRTLLTSQSGKAISPAGAAMLIAFSYGL